MKHAQLGGAIVVNPDGKIIIVHNGDVDTWGFPKGHVEAGETNLETARRELAEETGVVDAELVRELGTYQRMSRKNKELKNIHMFLFRSSVMDFKPTERKITEVRWVTIDEAAVMLTYEKDREFLKSLDLSL